MKTRYNISIIYFVLLVNSCVKSTDNIQTKNSVMSCDLSQFSKEYVLNGCEVERHATPVEISASVMIMTTFTDFEQDYCTGTFVGEHSILTAAHCFPKKVLKINVTASNEITNINKDKTTAASNVVIPTYYSENCIGKDNDIENKLDCSFGDIAIIKSEKSATQLGISVAKVVTSIVPVEPVLLVGYGLSIDGNLNTVGYKRYAFSHVTNLSSNDRNDINNFKVSDLTTSVSDYYSKRIKNNPSVGIMNDFYDPVSTYLLITSSESGICSGDSGGAIYVKRDSMFYAAGVVHAAMVDDNGYCATFKSSLNTLIGAYKNWINDNIILNGDKLGLQVK